MKVGDIILTNNTSFIARAIRLFMRRYAKKLGVHVDKFYNHAAICVEYEGKKLIAESMIKGVQIKQTPEEFLEHNPNHLILTWIDPLSEKEQELVSDIAINYSLMITRYDFANFIQQIRLINSGIWYGKTGEDASKRLYCSELVAICMDAVRGVFPHWWSKNPLDIQLSEVLTPEA